MTTRSLAACLFPRRSFLYSSLVFFYLLGSGELAVLMMLGVLLCTAFSAMPFNGFFFRLLVAVALGITFSWDFYYVAVCVCA